MRPAPALAVPCKCRHKLQHALGLEGAPLPCVWQAVLRSPPPPGPSNLLITALPGKPAAVAGRMPHGPLARPGNPELPAKQVQSPV